MFTLLEGLFISGHWRLTRALSIDQVPGGFDSDPSKGYNYYRLIQTDLDSKQQVSPVRQITIAKSMDVRLCPNPAKEWLSVELPEQGSSIVNLFNANGQFISRQTYNTNSIKLSLQQIPRGHYQIIVDQNGKKYTQQLVKE